jgi:hypothetical protein
MAMFVIEREFPGAEHLSSADLRGIAAKASEAMRAIGARVQWIESFVAADRIYCIYTAPDQAALLEHARRAGLPATRVDEVCSVIGPVQAEQPGSAEPPDSHSAETQLLGGTRNR